MSETEELKAAKAAIFDLSLVCASLVGWDNCGRVIPEQLEQAIDGARKALDKHCR